MKYLLILAIAIVATLATDPYDDSYMHHFAPLRSRRNIKYTAPTGEQTAEYWNEYAQLLLKDALDRRPIEGKAKNVIMFLGDGMSIPTLGATRVYFGQQFERSGEESYLSFERFPYVGLSKTYCVDRQVADSACSATAYLCGVKANYGTIGVTGAVDRNNCDAMNNITNHVLSVAHWAQLAGKSTGLVTTTRVTHASPAGTYAHTANRDWESDKDVLKNNQDPLECIDIASQLVYGPTGKNMNVIFGGGRKNFLPKEIKDDEGHHGYRTDGQNLIQGWENMKKDSGVTAKYIWHKDSLKNVTGYDSVLGLFDTDHMPFNLEADYEIKPTLIEMTSAAIKILEKNPNGYFLFVEGGRIDHGHHETSAKKALDETVQFSLAVEEATKLTNPEDTLIVVTSDHAHTMSYSGYPERGNDIFGLAGMSDVDSRPYSTLSYANGPGYKHPDILGNRYDISHDPMGSKDYKYPSLAPIKSETHGGDDVGIFAIGPWAHLFTGVHEENLIPHIMKFAACLGKGLTYCDMYKF